MFIFSQEIDFEDFDEEDFVPAPPSSHIQDPAPQVPHNYLDSPSRPALDHYPATVLLLGLQTLVMRWELVTLVLKTSKKRPKKIHFSQSIGNCKTMLKM